MKKLLFFLIPIFTGCTTQTFVNKSGSCKLRLQKDSTYSYKYPTFLRTMRDKGNYTIKKDSILLKSREENKIRRFYYHNDTILDNGVDPKAIGSDRRLMRK
jgi:hypothetical protein